MRVVLDTNVVVSALVFERGHLAWVRAGWRGRQFFPLIDRPCADELLRVLGYRKCGLSREDVEVLLESYLPYATTVDSVGRGPRDVPECSDPEDQKFLDLAAIGRAEVLVTGDRALLDCAGMTKVAIERPSDFRGRLTIAASQS